MEELDVITTTNNTFSDPRVPQLSAEALLIHGLFIPKKIMKLSEEGATE